MAQFQAISANMAHYANIKNSQNKQATTLD